MIKAVSFQGTQPAVEKKEPQKSHAAAGVVIGAAAGAGAGYQFGKVPLYKDEVAFMNSGKVEEELNGIKDEAKKADVEKLKTVKTDIDAANKAVDTKIEEIFGKGTEAKEELKLNEVLPKLEGTPSLKDLQDAGAKDAEVPFANADKDLKSIQEKAKALKTSESGIIGEQKKDAEVVNVVKGADDKVTVVKGKMVEDGAADKFKFEPHAGDSAYSKELAEHEKAVTEARKAFDAKKALATKFGITAESTADTVVKKSAVKEALAEAPKKLAEEAKTAFGNIKEHLTKTTSGKNIGIYAAVGAVVLGLVGHMMKKKEA